MVPNVPHFLEVKKLGHFLKVWYRKYLTFSGTKGGGGGGTVQTDGSNATRNFICFANVAIFTIQQGYSQWKGRFELKFKT